jgi:hypothetical protein
MNHENLQTVKSSCRSWFVWKSTSGQPGRPPARTQVAALVVVVNMLNRLRKQTHEDMPRAGGAQTMLTRFIKQKEFNMD